MKNTLLYLVLVVFVSCKSTIPVVPAVPKTQPTAAYTQQIEYLEQENYFTATGNEPSWSLKIAEKGIQFTSLKPVFESFTAPHVTPERAMDANVKRYQIAIAAGTMTIEIFQQECENTMSGAKLPHSVKIEITKGKIDNSTVFKGCGVYITDPRLHDIWVLEKMNGENVNSTKFKGAFPNIEINTMTNRFSGFGGCNSISGGLFFENGLLRFTNTISTMMACEPQNRESEFLTSLQSTTFYSIENLRLTLKNQSGIELIFKKVD
ncbi:META domain-containing protein [Flavobacterium restrictum]|uniref:META domain-containing protein n=1 Tax=Flavobacterium restrictum TaxID=2594428 RepID=A0A553ECX6_9FLAO|nr:META domain-containing protein [Flavobacterium restrictum]TRX42842.1 META domain-containing protein [Flavobacterium restrictum]